MTGHVTELLRILARSDAQWVQAARWGRELAERLPAGARLLVAGNGGSAAQAQHLSAELVGRYCTDRQPLSAIALHAETSSLTAIVNDYGAEEMFARQVRAHGRPGDVLLTMSTSGRSRNLVCALDTARGLGVSTWAMTGRGPNPLARAAESALVVDSADTSTVQETHLVVVHLICEALDAALGVAAPQVLAERAG
jgi:D-sedoheptulose 7-phosphate isomerase